MSTNQTERATCESLFATGWGSTTPIDYENVPFTAPSAAPWVRIVIRPGPAVTGGTTGSTALNVTTGRVWVQVFVPEGTGTDKARQLADSAASIFGHQRSNGLLFLTPEFTAVGVANGYFQYNVSVPYRRYSDDTLT